MIKNEWKCTTLDQLSACFNFLRLNMPEAGWRIGFREWKERRSLSMNALQHVIYEEISRYLVARGRTDWTPRKVKDELKNQYLGWEDQEFTDLKTGQKTTRPVLRSTAGLDRGEAVFYTDQILEFASSIGCEIKIPARGEYADYREAQLQ